VLKLSAGKYLGEETAPLSAWYELLGHDAALLSERVLLGFPSDFASGEAARQLHRRFASELPRAQGTLLSSERRGFLGTRRLARSLTVLGRRTP
jgi:hypothetical protein